jgi:CO/xanthine dehydrogenase FAD-binding subunit
MKEFNYYRPATIPELKESLNQPGAHILAGGTDIIPKMRRGQFAPSILVDTSGIGSLRFIEDQGDLIVIGALATHLDMERSPLLRNLNPALSEAAHSVGCSQTRSRGTLGGNIANASPAGDTIPPLMIYDTSLLVQSMDGERWVSLEGFITGPGKTDLKDGEFIHSASFAPFSGAWGASFIKFGKRSGMAVSVVNASAAVVLDQEGLISQARIALGAVAPVVRRCREAEEYLLGKDPAKEHFIKAAGICREEIDPITDIRSNTEYRLHAASVIARRALEAASISARGRMA